MAVASVDTSKQEITSHKMKNITSYNDITFHEDGMTVRQAYDIGKGKLMTKDLHSYANGRTQGDTGLVVVEEFSKPHVIEGRVNCHTIHRVWLFVFIYISQGC